MRAERNDVDFRRYIGTIFFLKEKLLELPVYLPFDYIIPQYSVSPPN